LFGAAGQAFVFALFFFFLDEKEAKNQGCTCFAKNLHIAAVATQAAPCGRSWVAPAAAIYKFS
jgi:hypothetical protein